MRWRRALTTICLLAAAPASGRDLPVPPDKGWQHAATGLILPATLDGLARTTLADLTAGEFDVVAGFAGPGDPVFATVYVFQPAVASVPIWFERSEWMVEHRDAYGSAAPASAEPVAFAPPGAASASALRRAYAPTRGGLRSTALAVLPLGSWLVAVRMSSGTLAPSALDAHMTRLIAAIRWPATTAPAPPAAAPVPACATPLPTGRAKPKKDTGANALFPLLLGAVAHDPAVRAKAKGNPVSWCRDPAETDAYAVFRADLRPRNGYVIALADAGRTIAVTPTLDAITGKDESYSVTFNDVDASTTGFRSFVGLPSPAQAIAMVKEGHATGRSSPGSKQITINAGSFGK